MRHTVILTTGLCGFGITRGLFPEVRCGIVAIGWCRGSLRIATLEMLAAERAKADAIIERMGQRIRDILEDRK